jgi:hypothetical protein
LSQFGITRFEEATMQTANLKRLVWFAAVFLAGWRLWLWAAENQTLVEFVPLIWFYAAIGIAMLVLLLAMRPNIQIIKHTEEPGLSITIVFSVGWRIILPMAVGFGISQALAWWIFYSGRWYYPQADDVLALAAFGCNISALVGAIYLIGRQMKVATSNRKSLTSAAPIVCFQISLFLCGGFAAIMSDFAMDRFTPELAATAAGVLATVGICVMAQVVQPSRVACVIEEC